ncbi:MAG: glycosyltransferase family 1 protein [Acidimicrobiia bacterium]
MRVALNLEQLLQHPPGGIGRYTAELARLLPRPPGEDEAIELLPFVAFHRRGAIDRAVANFGLVGIDPIRFPLPRPVLYDAWHLLGRPSLRSMHAALGDVDVVHAPSVAVPPRGEAALVVTVHDAATELLPETFPRRGLVFHRRGMRAAHRRADLVIVSTVAAAEEVVDHSELTMEQIRIVPHGTSQAVAGSGLVRATLANVGLGDQPYVLWVGTREPRKNLTALLDAFGAVVRTHDLPHQLAIVGPKGWLHADGDERRRAEALGDRVQFLGPVRADRLVALYRGADLLAFPSLHEGFGLPVVEAMAQETAVVCADIPVLREVGGGAAHYVDPTDHDALGEALVELLRDDGARAALARAGKNRAATFAPERFVENTLAVYREAIELRRSS